MHRTQGQTKIAILIENHGGSDIQVTELLSRGLISCGILLIRNINHLN
ncbi:MAG: hypothetical protein ACI909_003779 [Planctomycetota bacterium]|jgi:hypothetical protein